MTESVTDLRECPHGPVNDCPRCFNKELVTALRAQGRWRRDSGEWHVMGCHEFLDHEAHWPSCANLRILLDKAKQMVQ